LLLDGYTPGGCLDSTDCIGKVASLTVCQRALCVEGQCVAGPALVGTTCTPTDTLDDCQIGVCAGVGEALACTPKVAPDGTPCALTEWEAPYTVRTCAKGVCGPATQCAVVQDCLGLEDGNFCNGVLRCVANACVIDPASVVDCTDAPASPCHEPICVPETGACGEKAVADDSPCENGDLCSSGDTCQAGQCVAGSKVMVCGGMGTPQCQKAVCNPATGDCENVPGNEGFPCADSNPCLKGDFCKEGTCMPGDTLVVCPQEGAGQCRQAVCDTQDGQCKFVNLSDSTLCDDDNECTQVDHCFSGTCSGFSPVDCSGEDAPECQKSACDPADGNCKLSDLPDETPCDDGDGCTGPDLCADGQCQSGAYTCGCPDNLCD
jgi:hypothetical protein